MISKLKFMDKFGLSKRGERERKSRNSRRRNQSKKRNLTYCGNYKCLGVARTEGVRGQRVEMSLMQRKEPDNEGS